MPDTPEIISLLQAEYMLTLGFAVYLKARRKIEVSSTRFPSGDRMTCTKWK